MRHLISTAGLDPRLGQQSVAERGVRIASGDQLHRQWCAAAAERGADFRRRRTRHHPAAHPDRQIRRRIRPRITNLRRFSNTPIRLV